MALRLIAIVCLTSFLLGILFTHWIADSLTLWKTPITDANLWTAASYYNIIMKGPPSSGYLVSGAVALGATCILWSLRDGEAGNIMFDGGSIFLFGAAVVSYVYSALPSLFANFTTLPPRPPSDDFPASLRQEALDIASSHLICSVALTGVLALQAGRWWAERADDDEDAPEVEAEKPVPKKSRRRGKSGARK